MSGDNIQVAQLHRGGGVSRLRRAAERSLGIRRQRTGAAAHFLAGAEDRRASRSAHGMAATLVGFAFSIPGMRNGHAYLHSHMLAVKAEYRNSGLGRRAEALSARGCHRARLRTDRVDLRSAGDQERLSQPGAAGRDRAPLQHQSVRHHVVAAAGISSHRPPGGGVVAEIEARGIAAVERARCRAFDEADAHRGSGRDLCVEGACRRRGRKPRRCSCAIASSSCKAFSQGLACLRYGRDENGSGVFVLGKWDEDWSYASA